VSRYYHVMKKQGQWHLYAGNAVSALMADVHQANIMRAARTLARQNSAKVILHRDDSDTVFSPPRANGPGEAVGAHRENPVGH
jgi:hypothetical protein